MADKRISQLTDRGTVANNDVIPIVVNGAVTTNKATISSIQTFMQGNLDLGVTSVGITLGSSGTDVNVTGSPITTSGNITINIPDASTSARGVVTTGAQNFAGNKSFQNTIFANAGVRLDQNGTALQTFIQNSSGTGLITTNANGVGFNNSNNFFFAGSNKGCAVFEVNNTAVRNYTLQNADGTLAFTSDLSGFVTLGTAQTITAQKTFTGSGSSDTMIISHGSGSGLALDVIKGGNGPVIRVLKTSGSGNAMTVQGGNFEAPTIVRTGGTSSQFLMADGSVNTSVLPSGAYLPLAGGTLTGPLNGTSAVFSGDVTTTNAARPYFISKTTSVGEEAGIKIQQGSVSNWIIGTAQGSPSANDLAIRDAQNGRIPLFFAASTGAATFSSSVTALEFLSTFSGNGFNANFNKTGGFGGCIQLKNTSALSSDLIRVLDSANNIISRIEPATGGINFAQGNVGIGTATPASGKLEIQQSTTTAALWVQTAGTDASHIIADFRTGTNSPALQVQGNGTILMSSLGTGTVSATSGVLSTSSDSSYKVDDGFIDSALDKVLNLKPRYFYWNEKSGLPMDIRQLGFYAQEVNEALGEEAANTPQDENTSWGIMDRSVIAMLTKAIQEQQEQIDSLKNQIK